LADVVLGKQSVGSVRQVVTGFLDCHLILGMLTKTASFS